MGINRFLSAFPLWPSYLKKEQLLLLLFKSLSLNLQSRVYIWNDADVEEATAVGTAYPAFAGLFTLTFLKVGIIFRLNIGTKFH